VTHPAPAYDGNGPYLFVSYAHADSDRVYRELVFLQQAGVNVWYDEGITPGSRWSDELANAIDHADLFLVFLTEAAVKSENCLNEIDFALRRRRPFLAVELEPVTLPPGIELNIGNRQSILAHRFAEADYRARLLDGVQRNRSEGQTLRGAGLAHAPPLGKPKRFRTSHMGRYLFAIGAVLILSILALLAYRPAEQAGQVKTLAVLPFANLSRDHDFDYLGEGLADELITTLGSFEQFSVSSRTSSFYFRDQAPRMQDIRDRLGVSHAIEGSLRPEAGGIVINVSLFETIEGRQIWARQFNTTSERLSEVSTEIASAVTLALYPGIDLKGLNQIASPTAIAADAYEAYLRGLDFLSRPPTPETLDAARLFFSSALELAPDFERASAALCETHLTYYRMARTENVEIHYQNAVNQCEAAIELDATHWAGRQSLATLYRLSGRYEDALREIRLADTLQPDTATIQHEYGKILESLGEAEAAEQRLKRGIELDPGFWGGYADLGDFYYYSGRYREALEQFQEALRLSPDNGLMAVSLGATYYLLGDLELASEAWRSAIKATPDSEARAFWQSATWLGINSLHQGCAAEAAYWQQQAISVSPNDHRLWGRLAESCQMQQADPLAPDASSKQVYQRAIELAEAELIDNPNDWETLSLLALYRARVMSEAPARQLIERSLELQPGNPDAIETALLYATQINDKAWAVQLKDRLLSLNFPPSMLERNPFLAGRQQCPIETSEKERLICAQGKIIPAVRN
jgi:TolB-like protein/Flp pilus assembly protein TadD